MYVYLFVSLPSINTSQRRFYIIRLFRNYERVAVRRRSLTSLQYVSFILFHR